MNSNFFIIDKFICVNATTVFLIVLCVQWCLGVQKGCWKVGQFGIHLSLFWSARVLISILYVRLTTEMFHMILNMIFDWFQYRNDIDAWYPAPWGILIKMNRGWGDTMTRKHFEHYWPFRRGIHRSPVDSPPKGPSMRNYYFLLLNWTRR